MAGRLPELTFTPYRFELGDTIEVVDKQNGQLDAMEAFAKDLNAVMETVDQDVEEVRLAQQDVVQKGVDAVADIDQSHEDRKAQIGAYADQRYQEYETYANQRFTEHKSLADSRDAQFRRIFNDKYGEFKDYADGRYQGHLQYADQRQQQHKTYADHREADLTSLADGRELSFNTLADSREQTINDIHMQADTRATSAEQAAIEAKTYRDDAQAVAVGDMAVSNLKPARWVDVITDHTLEVNQWYRVDATSGPLTLTLPDLPAKDDAVVIALGEGTLVDSEIHAATGDTIEGDEFLLIDVEVKSVTLIFDGNYWTVR